MFNVTGGELIIILILALIVLGPEKLPDAIRRFAKFYGEFKKMSAGFQSELRNALDEPLQELRSTADLLKQQIDTPASAINDTAAAARQQMEATAAAATAAATGTADMTGAAPPAVPAGDEAASDDAVAGDGVEGDGVAGDGVAGDGVAGDCDGPAPEEWQHGDGEAPSA